MFADKGKGIEKQYYVTDPHGNVVQLTDWEGKVIKTYEYDSFGNEVKPDEKDDNPFRYCGEYYDKEIGEVYLRARYYQPEKGRFLTRDTYTGEEDEPRSLHLYAYCYNNPVTYRDNSGNSPNIVAIVSKGANAIHNVIKSNEKRQKKKHNKEMNKFINGNKKKLKKETIYWWAEHGDYKTGTLFSYSKSSWNQYDNAIMAFNNYWILKLKVKKNLRVNPNYIKAMVYNESTMGETNKKDIMTAFFVNDPDVHIMARNRKAYERYYGNDYDPNEGIKYGLPSKGYKAVQNLYSNNKFYKNRINYQLSLCFGIRWLYYKTMESKSVIKGIAKYNGGGDDKYMRKIKNTLSKNSKPDLVKGKVWNKKPLEVYK